MRKNNMKTFVLKEPLISHLKYCYYKNSRNIKFDHEMLSAMSRSFTIMGGIKARDQYKPLIFSYKHVNIHLSLYLYGRKRIHFSFCIKSQKTFRCVTLAIITLNTVTISIKYKPSKNKVIPRYNWNFSQIFPLSICHPNI